MAVKNLSRLMLVIFVLSSFSTLGALTDDQRLIEDEPAPASNRRFQTLGFSLGTTFADIVHT